MIGGQFLEVPQQFRVAAVEGLVETAPRILVGLGPHQADQRAVDQVHPPQPFQGQVTSEETGRPGQQDSPHLGAGRGSVGAAVSVAASMNLSSVRSPACTSVVLWPCTDAKLGPLAELSCLPNCWLRLLTDGA